MQEREDQEYGDITLQEREDQDQSSCQWAELHQPLLELILRRLSLPDYLRSGSVCQQWLEVKRHLRHADELPMLFLSKVLVGRPTDSQLFLCPSEGRCYHVDTKLEGSSERHVNCIASSHGWLLVHDFFVPANLSKLFLLNPFSGSRIELPDYEGFRYYFGRPIALSSSPTDPSCKIMIAHYLYVMHCRLGDTEPRWTKRQIFCRPQDFFIHDIIFVHHSQRFYGLTNKYDLVFLDYSMDTALGRVDLDRTQMKPLRRRITQPYLVECMGEILLVRLRDFNLVQARRANCSPGLHVDVFRANLHGNASWVRVHSLEGGAIFVGEGCSGWIPASQAGTRGDRIYCSRSRLQLTSRRKLDKKEWCWIEYDLRDGRIFIHTAPEEIERRINYSIFWVMPSLQ